MDALEKLTGLRTLDDAVVIGRGEGHDLRDRIAGNRLRRCSLPFSGVLHGADADDAALAGHQARHGVHGANAARIGERDRGADEIVGGQRACACLAHDLLVGRPELCEVHRLRSLDGRDHQLA